MYDNANDGIKDLCFESSNLRYILPDEIQGDEYEVNYHLRQNTQFPTSRKLSENCYFVLCCNLRVEGNVTSAEKETNKTSPHGIVVKLSQGKRKITIQLAIVSF